MNEMLYGWKVDYVNRHGHYLLLQSPGIALHSGMASKLQINMLQANAIPRLLPMSFEEIDGEARLYYGLSGKKRLTNVLQQSAFALEQYIQLLLNIAAVVEDCATYMLREDQFVIHPDYLFCGEVLEDVHIVYVPWDPLPGKGSVQQDLRQLCSTVLRRAGELYSTGLQPIMTYVLDEEFHIGGLKKLLIRTFSAIVPATEPGKAVEEHMPALAAPEKVIKQHSGYTDDTYKEKISIPQQSQAQELFSLELPSAEESESAEADMDIKASRPYIPVASAVLLIWTIIGRWLTDQSEMKGFHWTIALLAAVGSAGAGIYILYYRKPKRRLEANLEGDETVPPGNDSVMSMPILSNFGSVRNELPLFQARQKVEDQALAGTTQLSSDITVFLKSSGAREAEGSAYLEAKADGGAKKLPLPGGTFIIGRGGANVHHIDESPGISRAHAEIVQTEGHYIVKDLGSKNGTWLNGEQMVPYKGYALHDGDVVRIVRSEYTFCLSRL